jgi:nucleotide-binding universal stress UspA family protein
MSYKTLLVHAGTDEPAARRLRLAADLAGRFGATVIGAAAELPDPWLEAVAMNVDSSVAADAEREAVAHAAQAERVFRRELSGLSEPVFWRSGLVSPADALIAAAAGADLVIVSRTPERGVDPDRALRPGDVVMAAGAPVLIAPPGRERLDAEAIVVGWKNTREARRAISDALPFLIGAKQVLLVSACERQGAAAVAEQMAAVVARLARHGVEATARKPFDDPDPAALLLAVAAGERADLVVAGAYGHSPLREWVFGGVTQNLLTKPGCFVLLSR